MQRDLISHDNINVSELREISQAVSSAVSIAYADTTTIPIDKKQDSIIEKDNLVINENETPNQSLHQISK